MYLQSYAARGVTEAMYQVYWDAYIEPRWQEHGASRATDPAVMGHWTQDAEEGGHLVLSCHHPVPQLVQQVLATGWFEGKGASTAAGGSDAAVEDKSVSGGSAESSAHGTKPNIRSSNGSSLNDSRTNGGSHARVSNASAMGNRKSGPQQQQPSTRIEKESSGKDDTASSNSDGSKEVRYKDDGGFPAVTSIAVAVLVTGLLSTLDTAPRSAVFVVLGSFWWHYRGRELFCRAYV
jgi:cobalamin biosynthesis Mg chelatase CobN